MIGSTWAQQSGNGRALAVLEVKPDGLTDTSGWELCASEPGECLFLTNKILLYSWLFWERRILRTVCIRCLLISFLGGVTVIAVCIAYSMVQGGQKACFGGSLQRNCICLQGVRVLRRQCGSSKNFIFKLVWKKTRGHDVRRGSWVWVCRVWVIKSSSSEVSNH